MRNAIWELCRLPLGWCPSHKPLPPPCRGALPRPGDGYPLKPSPRGGSPPMWVGPLPSQTPSGIIPRTCDNATADSAN